MLTFLARAEPCVNLISDHRVSVHESASVCFYEFPRIVLAYLLHSRDKVGAWPDSPTWNKSYSPINSVISDHLRNGSECVQLAEMQAKTLSPGGSCPS